MTHGHQAQARLDGPGQLPVLPTLAHALHLLVLKGQALERWTIWQNGKKPHGDSFIICKYKLHLISCLYRNVPVNTLYILTNNHMLACTWQHIAYVLQAKVLFHYGFEFTADFLFINLLCGGRRNPLSQNSSPLVIIIFQTMSTKDWGGIVHPCLDLG